MLLLFFFVTLIPQYLFSSTGSPRGLKDCRADLIGELRVMRAAERNAHLFVERNLQERFLKAALVSNLKIQKKKKSLPCVLNYYHEGFRHFHSTYDENEILTKELLIKEEKLWRRQLSVF